MRAIRNSVDIDQALEAVYGLDQYGLDTAWRIFMGMEPLPKPEEREFTLPQIPTPTRVPTPTPYANPTQPPTLTSEPTATTLPPTPTPMPAPTETPPSPTPEPTSAAALEDGGDGSSPGCAGPYPGRSGKLRGDLAMLVLLATPAAMLLARTRRRP